jgi:hypothetical protein
MIGSMASSVVVLLLSFAPSPSRDDTEARWREEYPRAMRELQAILRTFSAEGRFTRRFFNGEVAIADDFKLAASGGRRLVVRDRRSHKPTPKEGNPNGDVWCLTPEYAFHLRRTSEAGPYLILSYGPREAGDDLYVNMDFDSSVLCMTEFGGQTLLDRMQSPTFVLKAVERTLEGESEVVRIDYSWESERGSESGSVHLEPARKWAIRRSDVLYTAKPPASAPESKNPPGKPDPPIRRQTEVAYQDLPGGKPFPVRTVVTVTLPDPTKFQEERFEAKRVTLDEPPSEWFELSGYGLPDVPLQPAHQTSVFSLRNPWLWISLATALVSFGLLWWLRRRPSVLST